MIKLANGRGQLGTILEEKVGSIKCDENIWIYHTWNIDDKSQKRQLSEYNKFIDFVEDNKKEKIIFISTSSQKDNWYNYYKHLSEAFLLTSTDNCVIIRLPTLIGKGTFVDLKMGVSRPHGYFNLMTLKKACDIIIDKIFYNGKIKSFHIIGEDISAESVKDIMCL
jgi:hypothetical protein